MLAIEDTPAWARARSVRPTAEEMAARAEACAAVRAAKEEEKACRFLEREERKMNRRIARDALEYEKRKRREARDTRETAMTRPVRSPTGTPLGAKDFAAAAEAALGKPRPRAKSIPKEVTKMAEAKFRRRNIVKKVRLKDRTQLQDTIRLVPVKETKAAPAAKPRARRGRNRMEPAAIAVA
jgi:hypothetical protein